jgi:hypothetical protein
MEAAIEACNTWCSRDLRGGVDQWWRAWGDDEIASAALATGASVTPQVLPKALAQCMHL